eukprot:6869773-Lingulodinium_polyedra.AAC.1
MALAAGSWVVVCYDVPGQPLYHERLVTAVGAAANCAVLTPDGDHYVEQLALINEDLADIRFIAGSGDTPVGLDPARIYRFQQVPSPAERRALQRDGQLM